MVRSMLNTPEFKRAAIDWLLTNGQCESMTETTRDVLAALSVRGVDYEASGMPDFTTVAIDPGDTDAAAVFGEAFAATIYPLGSDPTNWREGHEFWVGKDDVMKALLSNMIMGVIAAFETGDSEWKARANEREVERLLRRADAEAERQRMIEEAAANAVPTPIVEGTTFKVGGLQVAVTKVTETEYTFATRNSAYTGESWTFPLPTVEGR